MKMGTLNEDTQLRPAFWQQNMADNSNAGFVEFKKDTGVYFDENGLVTAGTIKEAAPWKTGGTVTTLTEKLNINLRKTALRKRRKLILKGKLPCAVAGVVGNIGVTA